MERMQNHWDSHPLLAGMQQGTATAETLWQLVTKLDIHVSHDTAMLLPAFVLESRNLVFTHTHKTAYECL